MKNILNWHATDSTVLVRIHNFTSRFHSLVLLTRCIFQSLNSYHNNMILFWVLYCCKILCLLFWQCSEFSNSHSAMSLTIIDFILRSCHYYWKFLDFDITLTQDGLEQTFSSSFTIWQQIFVKDTKLVAQKISKLWNFLHHCCDQVKSSVTDVFTNYFICSFKWWLFETNRCMYVQFGNLVHNYEYCNHSFRLQVCAI